MIYDHDENSFTPVPRGTEGKSYPFGVSWHGDRLFIAWRHPYEILEYDQAFKPTGRKCESPEGSRTFGDIHQITCFDGKIWTASTGCNKICVHDAETLEFIEDWAPHKAIPEEDFPTRKSKKAQPHYKHYNSIMFNNNRVYINAHMTVHNPPSRVWVFKYPSKKFIRKIRGGLSTHNIFFVDNILTVCDSGHGQILQPESGKVLFKSKSDSFLRGISMPPGLLIIGTAERCARPQRPNAKGGLIFIKNKNFNNPQIKLLGKGPVEEIRCLDMDDEAHPVKPFLDKK